MTAWHFAVRLLFDCLKYEERFEDKNDAQLLAKSLPTGAAPRTGCFAYARRHNIITLDTTPQPPDELTPWL